MKMIYYLAAIVIFCFTSCHPPIVGQTHDVILVDCIRKENNFELAKTGLVRVGVGSGYKSDESTLRESYQTRRVKFQDMEQARSYFIKVFNEYVKPFNANSHLASVVKTYPFSSSNTEVRITFLGQNGGPVIPPYIAQIRNEGDSILLYTYDETGRTFTEVSRDRF